MYEEAVVNVSKFIVKLYGCLSKTGQASYDRCLNSVPQSTRGPVPAARATVPTTRCLSCQKFTNLGLLFFVTSTFFIFVTLYQYRKVGQFFTKHI
jgi:hypothetical protein